VSDTIAATMPISWAAERVGLSVDTLRYYERAGLIEPVSRAPGGQRQYAEADVVWLEFHKIARYEADLSVQEGCDHD